MKRKDDRAEKYAKVHEDYVAQDIRSVSDQQARSEHARWYLERAFRAGCESERRKMRREAKSNG